MYTLLFTLLTVADGATFVPIGTHHGVEVYQRKDTPDIELAAVGEINGSPAEVQAVLEDYGHHPRFVPRLIDSQVLTKKPGEQLVYQYLKLPIIRDRDYTLRVTWEDGQAKGLRFSIVTDRGPAPKPTAVRMTTLSGQWMLEPIRGGQATRATYRVHIDFSGSVPRGFVRSGAAKELPGLFDGIRYEVTAHHPNSAATAATAAQR